MYCFWNLKKFCEDTLKCNFRTLSQEKATAIAIVSSDFFD